MNYLFLWKIIFIFILAVSSSNYRLDAQSKPQNRPPALPMNIPPPPNFAGSTSKNGKYQIVSAEYYSQDSKPFLYKRLVKLDTSTGDAWVLQSTLGSKGEIRKWVPLESSKENR